MVVKATLSEAEVRAISSLLSRVADRLATYEEQTDQDTRHAEELEAVSDDLLTRLEETRVDLVHGPLTLEEWGAD